MQFHPSAIQSPEELKLKIKEIKIGLYIVENAYEGTSHYFPDKDTGENLTNDLLDDNKTDEKSEDFNN